MVSEIFHKLRWFLKHSFMVFESFQKLRWFLKLSFYGFWILSKTPMVSKMIILWFLKSFKNFLKVSSQVWCSSAERATGWKTYTEVPFLLHLKHSLFRSLLELIESKRIHKILNLAFEKLFVNLPEFNLSTDKHGTQEYVR